jgi:hypothetical protein
MDPELQATADHAFGRRIEETGARDPREFYRRLLRDLRQEDEAGYTEMVRRYEEDVVGPVARGEVDPLEAWLRFGSALAERLHEGRTVVVDESGRATPLSGAPSWEDLVLHLPRGRGMRALPVGIPPEPSAAQRATLELLVQGRVRLP